MIHEGPGAHAREPTSLSRLGIAQPRGETAGEAPSQDPDLGAESSSAANLRTKTLDVHRF